MCVCVSVCVFYYFVFSVFFDEFIRGFEHSELTFEPLPFNHPLFIMYSSGTTGIPKCMVHSVGVSVLVTHYSLITVVM